MKKSLLTMLVACAALMATALVVNSVNPEALRAQDAKEAGKEKPAEKEEKAESANVEKSNRKKDPLPSWETITANRGAYSAIVGFFGMLDGDLEAAKAAMDVPFSMDAKKVIKERKELDEWIAKVAEDKAASIGILQMKLLPPGNSEKSAANWLWGADNMGQGREKKLFDYANEHKGWLATVWMARKRGDEMGKEGILIALKEVKDDKGKGTGEFKVIGFMD